LSGKEHEKRSEAMSGRFLLTTVSALALALPAMAQDAAAPSDTEQQLQQGAQGGTAPGGATEQAPAMTEGQPGEAQPPATTAEQPATGGATEQAPAMTEEQPTEE
jgi:hypothetical protein